MNSSTTVAITGATGFIGGRLAEILWLRHGVRARCLVRNFARCALLSRMPVQLAVVKLDPPAGLDDALRGVDVLVHCAYDFRDDRADSLRVNLAAMRNLMQAARAAGVKRIVHLSTTAAYGFSPPARCGEETALQEENDAYVDTKIALERLLQQEFADQPWVVVRPSIVFGPWSGAWTTSLLDDIRTRQHPLVDAAPAPVCNTTYVDNLVEAVLLVATHEQAVRGQFNVTDGQPPSWLDFTAAHARLLGVEMRELTHVPAQSLAAMRLRLDRIQQGGIWPVFYNEQYRSFVRNLLAGRAAAPVSGPAGAAGQPARPGPNPLPSQLTPGYLPEYLLRRFGALRLAAMSSAAVFPADRLAALGYRPAVGLDEAMRRIEQWMRFLNVLT